jgi:hypothetical protein
MFADPVGRVNTVECADDFSNKGIDGAAPVTETESRIATHYFP